MSMKIGVIVDSFRLPFKESVEKAAKLNVSGIQAYATYGELAPENMTDAKIKETLDIVKSHGLIFSAICGDLGCGFTDAEKNPELIEKSKRIIDLAKKLECDVVTTHIGHITEEETAEKEVARKACRELALYADSIGSAFAVETGPETGVVLAGFLDSLGAMGVRVNFDPANLVMLIGDKPTEAVKALSKYIVHTHAKDGVKLENGFLEVPLGQGGVDFDTYLPALKATGFDGFLTIEREVGDDPSADIMMAADFLREKIAKYGL